MLLVADFGHSVAYDLQFAEVFEDRTDDLPAARSIGNHFPIGGGLVGVAGNLNVDTLGSDAVDDFLLRGIVTQFDLDSKLSHLFALSWSAVHLDIPGL